MTRFLEVPAAFRRRETLLLAWVTALICGAGAMCSAIVFTGHTLSDPWPVAVLCLLAMGAERESIRLRPNLEVSVAPLAYVFAAVVFGPLAGVVVAAAGLLADLPRRDTARPILRWVTWTAIRVIVAGFAGLTALAVMERLGTSFLAICAAVAAALAAESVIDITLASITPVIRGTASLFDTVTSVGPTVILSIPLHTPMVAVLIYAYTHVSPWSVALFAAPAFAAQKLLLLYRKQREDTEALGLANARLAKANLSFATALVATLDARDRYTAGHSAAVAIYARDIAKRMGLTEREQDLVHLCGLVHDVGKIGLPAGLLEKPGALSLDERRQMEQHSMIGERILRNVDDYGEIAGVVRHHHERVDGNGYPDRLEGDEIPLLARVIAVADAYNAMTSDRPYRDAMPSRVARLRLAQAVESQFDTSVVAAFEAVLTGASEDYRMGIAEEFALEGAASQREEELVGELMASLGTPLATATA
ncbi:MAG TPA: HD-GYP domain-containing protein [Gaiellaceae bacterium]|jgi:putative nucleotidyltransferase with HDIG domain|nr:HD-GYP domain-containing protein [Gaiellaceae bacterium]